MPSQDFQSILSLNIHGKLYRLDSPKIMGILNITPDSFYDGDVDMTLSKAIGKVENMIAQGADMIDIGAMSSRPFSREISLEEESDRIAKFFPELIKKFPNTIWSIDTYRSEIAQYCLDMGASIVNDITAARKDEKILSIVSQYQCPYIVMHMQGTPDTMQSAPQYESVLQDVGYFFSERIDKISKYNISDIILDVGFGFGKSIPDNYHLLKNLGYFKPFHRPILVGISRKSMIYKVLDSNPSEALLGSTALHWEAFRQGTHILRVHDVKEAVEVRKLYLTYQES